jgi:hypothetical protein
MKKLDMKYAAFIRYRQKDNDITSWCWGESLEALNAEIDKLLSRFSADIPNEISFYIGKIEDQYVMRHINWNKVPFEEEVQAKNNVVEV